MTGFFQYLSLVIAVFSVANALQALKSSEEYIVDKNLIPGLEAIDDEGLIPQMYAGHIPYDDFEETELPNDFGYFFWKFQDHEASVEKPLIFWLNGGPGCSSMDGALVESGPLRVDAKGNAYLNSGSWHSRGDLVFVDQPFGTGFSSIKNHHDDTLMEESLDTASNHFVKFLINYFKIFPEDLEKEIVLAGESYAAQYIPFFAHFIKNSDVTDKDDDEILQKINLKVLLIGNGWIDPTTQSLSYLPFAMENNLVDEKNPDFKKLLNAHEACQNKVNSASESDSFEFAECNAIINTLLSINIGGEDVPKNEQCINVYNLDLKDSFPACGMNWPADVSYVTKFFTNEKVRRALHINQEWVPAWEECKANVGASLINQNIKPSINLLPDLLSSDLEIILFNGDKDLICNNRGILDTIEKLEWNGAKGFTENVEEYDWYYRNNEQREDEKVGFVKFERNLGFISVFNASHMVPHDKAEISRGIVDIGLNNVLLEVMQKRHALITGEEPFLDTVEEGGEEEDENNEKEETNNDSAFESDDEDNDSDDDSDSDDEEEDVDFDNDYEEEMADYELDEGDEYLNNEDEEYESFRVTIFIVFFICLSCAICLITFRDRLPTRLKTMFSDSYSRLDGSSKTVSWADDIENGVDFNIEDDDDDEFPEGDSNNKKKSQTSADSASNGNTSHEIDDSFEMRDM